MKIQYILIFLALGIVEGGRFRRWPLYISLPIPERMAWLQQCIEIVAEETDAAFEKMLEGIESSKENFTTILSKDLQDPAEVFKAKLLKELEEAKEEGNGKNVEKIQKCVEDEQKRYMIQFGEEYKTSLVCVENFTKAAKELIKNIKKTFPKYSFLGQAHADFMYTKWSKCIKTITNLDCIETVQEEYLKKLNSTKNQSKEAIEKGKEIIPKYKSKTEICVTNFKKGLEKGEKQHKNLVKKCVKNPKGKKD